jgi:uncharacterized protein YbaR (Trm112 family)
MEKKRIKCPVCGSLLDISFKDDGGIKHISCPVCKSRLKINLGALASQQGNKQEEPQNADDESETIIRRAPRRAVFRIVYNGIPFELKDGQNTIGRKAGSSRASLQIPTGDMTTSRSHLMIEVNTDANGNKYATLVNHNNTNATMVNEVEINNGDVIKLSDGDQIRMGEETVVVFETK